MRSEPVVTRERPASTSSTVSRIEVRERFARREASRLEGIDRDLGRARETQRHLLPRMPTPATGLDAGVAYRPARELGGDLVDFLADGSGRTGIVVGDAAGKGTAAALQAASTLGLLRGLAREGLPEPVDLLTALDAEVRQLSAANRFVALLYAVYDPQRRTLTLANGGLHRPLRLRDGRIDELQASGPPLGLLSGVRYRQTEVTLQPGDLVAFCSDGVTESANGVCEEYGIDRLARLITAHEASPAQAIADCILAEVDAFGCRRCREEDDRTVVVVRVRA